MLAIAFYNLGCQYEHIKNLKKALNSYKQAKIFQLNLFDPLDIGY